MAVEEGGTEEKEGGGEEIPPQGEGGQERKEIDCGKEEEEGGGQERKEPEGEKEEGEGEGEKEGAEVGRDGVEDMEEESTEPVTETGNHMDFKISSIIIGQVHNSCNVLTILHMYTGSSEQPTVTEDTHDSKTSVDDCRDVVPPDGQNDTATSEGKGEEGAMEEGERSEGGEEEEEEGKQGDEERVMEGKREEEGKGEGGKTEEGGKGEIEATKTQNSTDQVVCVTVKKKDSPIIWDTSLYIGHLVLPHTNRFHFTNCPDFWFTCPANTSTHNV